MNRGNKLILLCLAVAVALVAVIVMIYGFSSQSGRESNVLSLKIVDVMIDQLGALGVMPDRSALSKDELLTFNLILRKIAHGTLYCGLGLLSYLGLYGVTKCKRKSKARSWHGSFVFLSILLIVLVIASGDEWRQNFTERNGNMTDVGIDMLGGFVGACIGAFISAARGRSSNRRNHTS